MSSVNKAVFKQTKKLRKYHETRYFRKAHLYKNIAIYPLCSRKNLDFFLRGHSLKLFIDKICPLTQYVTENGWNKFHSF